MLDPYKRMNSVCEACDTRQATIYCMNCAKLHLYCQKCYETSHECDSKRLHKIQTISMATSGEEGLEEMLFCQEHGRKFKEYSCLTCNQSICSDCLIIGKHVGHEMNTIQKGYERIIRVFKTHLSEYEEILKLLDTKKTPAMDHLNNTLEEIRSMKQKIIEDTQNLIKTIEEETKEMIAIIDSEIESYIQNIKLLQKSTQEFNEMIQKCSESIKKVEAANHENYYKFSKNIRELEKTKRFFNIWSPIISLKGNKHVFPQLEAIKKCMIDVKEINITFTNRPKQSFDKGSIVSTVDHNMLLLTWISEACKTPRLSLKLLWKGTVDGFGASTFHNKCNNQGTTVTVVLSESNFIFGGFTTKSWAGNNAYTHDPEAFIFSLTHKTKLSKQKNPSYSIYCSSNHGPTFGGGHDIYICDNCNIDNSNYSNGNHTYDLPQGVNNKTYLAGAHNFKVKDIEVYSVKTY